MKLYIRRRPSGWLKMPERPALVLTPKEVQQWHNPLLTSFRRKVLEKASASLIRHSQYDALDIYDERGQILRTLNSSD